MMKLAFVAVFAFALGVLVRDVAEDYRKPPSPVPAPTVREMAIICALYFHKSPKFCRQG